VEETDLLTGFKRHWTDGPGYICQVGLTYNEMASVRHRRRNFESGGSTQTSSAGLQNWKSNTFQAASSAHTAAIL